MSISLRSRYEFRRAGAREHMPEGHDQRKCQECKGPATHVRRDCLVGGGHRRNVYYCAEHDYPDLKGFQ